MGAAVLFGLSVILLLRAEGRTDKKGNQATHLRRIKRIAVLGMVLAAALVALGFLGTQWWE